VPELKHEKLLEAESTVTERLGAHGLDFAAMAAISNIYRAAAAVRQRAEQTVLADNRLSWGGFTMLWVLWVWGEMETASLANECNLSKGTVSGMVSTLERQGLVNRTKHTSDRRRILVSLSQSGEQVITELFPEFNRFEQQMVRGLNTEEQQDLAALLRVVVGNATMESKT